MNEQRDATSECVFCEYALNGLPSHGVYEDDDFIVLLDTSPIGPAHTLIVPRRHVPRVYDLSGDQQARLFELAGRIVPLLLKLSHKSAVGYVAFGSGLPHAHLHLIPHNHSDELINPTVLEAERAQLESTAAKLRATAHVMAPRTPILGMLLMSLSVAAFYMLGAIGPPVSLVLFVIGSAIVADSRISMRRKLMLTLVPAAIIVAMFLILYTRNPG